MHRVWGLVLPRPVEDWSPGLDSAGDSVSAVRRRQAAGRLGTSEKEQRPSSLTVGDVQKVCVCLYLSCRAISLSLSLSLSRARSLSRLSPKTCALSSKPQAPSPKPVIRREQVEDAARSGRADGAGRRLRPGHQLQLAAQGLPQKIGEGQRCLVAEVLGRQLGRDVDLVMYARMCINTYSKR